MFWVEETEFESGMVLSFTGYLGCEIGTTCDNLPADAGDMGLIPSPGRFHMLQSS